MKANDLVAGFSILAAVTAFPCPAFADDSEGSTAHASLIGYGEVPSLASHARGTFDATISPGTLTYQLTYQGLDAPVTQSHIHIAQKGVNGGVIVFLCGTATNPGPAGTPTCPGPTSGTVTGMITALNVIGPSSQDISPGQFDELIRAMKAGVTYANVHSTKFPAGEIRGQISVDE